MKKITLLLIAGLIMVINLYAGNITYETDGFRMDIDTKGFIISIFDKLNNKEYLTVEQIAPLLSIRVNNKIEFPSQLKQKNNVLTLSFPASKVDAQVIASTKTGYLSFELIGITRAETIELIIWGPYPTTIGETIGECVGVVRNKAFAFGIQSLNVKTLGGFPDEENDIEPSYEILEAGSNIDKSAEWKNKKLYRGQTARVKDFGSVLQAYCRNRNKERIISNWAHDFYVAPAFNDGGVVGSKIALFGCPPEKALGTIGQIEIDEGLPHPLIDDEWSKTARSATSSYLIIGFNEDNLDQALELTKKSGLKYLYDGDPFKTWGHFVLKEKSYPENWISMKKYVERAKAQGLNLGVHTLSNFITTNDAYVTPVPDKRLAKVGESIITADIDEKTDEIPIKSPQFFNQTKNNSLFSVVIGKEIIRYKEVSATEPWKLTGCVRGAFNTKASAYKKGEVIGKLMDHGYKVFLSDAGLSDEIAKNIARLFNETGLLQISFDGLEGVWSTGMGQYARSLFTKTWYDNLKPELKGRVINDASNPSHFNWHINTRYNWGEPWYAGFRESQTYYRLMNQDFYRRNFLPSMLGWFSMSAETSVEDTEWLLARAAGFDAGFAFNLNFRTVERNGQSEDIFKAINTWETARMAGAFTSEQKLRMEDISNEYHLASAAQGQWILYPFEVKRFVHEQKIRQPGEPVFSTFEFVNPYENQPLRFMITLLPIDKSSESTVEMISIEVNNGKKIDIPVNIGPYEKLKMDETGKLTIYDRNWKLLNIIDLKNKLPDMVKGKNKIIFDAIFNGEGPSNLKIEIKTIGNGEPVKADNNECTSQQESSRQQNDWLISGDKYISKIILSSNGKELVLSNGLIERSFRITPNFATISIQNLITGQNYLRSVRPEAKITVNSHQFNIGGLYGQPVHNYLLTKWIENLTNDEKSFQFVKFTIEDIKPRFDWKIRKEWISGKVQWPAPGKELIVEFKAPEYKISEPSMIKGLVVKIHYEIYDGLPLISKWITVHNNSGGKLVLNHFISEILAAVEAESSVEGESDWQLPNMHVETDFAFSSMSNRKANNAAVHWMTDSTYTSQVNYALKTPCLLEIRPPMGPEWTIEPGQDFESFRAWELYFDSFDKERKGLSTRKMYRTIAPWVTENPVLMHVRSATSDAVKLAVDQCAEVGFEMVIMTFGSGFNMETGDTAYYRKIKVLADYAHSKGIALGGYSLLASRSVGARDDIINPATGKPGGIAYYGNSPCLGSEWGINYFRKIKEMYTATGLDIIEHDGSYPGDICGSTVHPGHKGLEDSQWSQFRTIAGFYQWCRSKGIYLNVPDWYYLNGSSKCAMGYREVNWSLPRANQEIIERQNIFDGTWTKTPSMGWMFVPLTEYHGGGAAATIEPLGEHLDHYAQRMANLFGAGVQACYRGPRLYDTDTTREVVKKWTGFYKIHRQILDSDIIHLRRPDGRDWDGLLHINPSATEKGLLMLYNPLEESIIRQLKIPVYYTGLCETVEVTDQDGKIKNFSVSRDYDIIMNITIPAKGYKYFILK